VASISGTALRYFWHASSGGSRRRRPFRLGSESKLDLELALEWESESESDLESLPAATHKIERFVFDLFCFRTLVLGLTNFSVAVRVAGALPRSAVLCGSAYYVTRKVNAIFEFIDCTV